MSNKEFNPAEPFGIGNGINEYNDQEAQAKREKDAKPHADKPAESKPAVQRSHPPK